MLSYTINRLLLAILIIVIAVATMFMMIHLVPGDPVNVILGPRATPEIKEALRAQLHLNEPILIQLGYFVGGLLQGDFGHDLISNRPVLDILLEQFPHTIILVFCALLVSILGIPLGSYAAIHRNGLFDRILGTISISIIAMPALVLGLYMLLFFSVELRWFPSIGAGDSDDWSDYLWHLVLPVTAIGIAWIGYISRVVRSSMIEVKSQNHVRMARAFGLPELTIATRYTLKLAALPSITMIGVSVAFILSSTVIVEIIFSRPGIGRLLYEAVVSRNYPLVMGTVLFSTVVIVGGTTITDLINAMLDPRSRVKEDH
ncbi:MAG: ABC transporter permease [Gammaproteobacteria bacterium]|jgi:peptide/nickel transport system permease protein|nr:ABC transporter permease [Gammaproteobacteria bacterium]